MSKLKFTRIVCLIMAVLFLVSTVAITASAGSDDFGITDTSIKDYMEELNTISYMRKPAKQSIRTEPSRKT